MTDPLAGFLLVLLGGLGLVVGSFLNVVIARVPAGASIVRPPSSCPSCHVPIRPRDNIPLVSWLILRGRCRACSAPISVRYPLVEALNGVLWVLIGLWSLQQPGSFVSPLLPTLLLVASAGVALTFIDCEHHRLPDAIVLPLIPAVVIGLAFAGLVSGAWPTGRALAGAAVWLALIGGIWLASQGRAMGFGDVKVAPALGVVLGWIGWGPAVVGLGAVWLIGGCVAAVILIGGRARRRQAMPFGPFLFMGFAVGVFLGAPLLDAYLSTVGLASGPTPGG